MTRVFAFLCLVSVALAACPPGTVYGSSFNKCYKYVTTLTSFLNAERDCESLGGSLVTITNSYENSFISGIASIAGSAQSYWIGVNLLLNSRWSWANGDLASYLPWGVGEPSDTSAYQCGAFRLADNMWTKEICNTLRPYMCQIDPNAASTSGCSTTPSPVTSTTPRSAGPCPTGRCPTSGFKLNPDNCKCYKYYKGLTTNYNQSEQVCSREGAMLTVILNQAENTWITSLAHNASSEDTNPWIGLWCYSNIPSSCRWFDGTPLYYTNFGAGYPKSNQPGYLDANTGRWYTFDSSSTGSFICQQTGLRYVEEPKRAIQGVLPNKAKRIGA